MENLIISYRYTSLTSSQVPSDGNSKVCEECYWQILLIVCHCQMVHGAFVIACNNYLITARRQNWKLGYLAAGWETCSGAN